MRLVEVVRIGYGSLLIAAPRSALRVAGESPDGGSATTVVRILGARHVAQAIALGRSPTLSARRVAAVIDGLHALSAALLAVLGVRHRRAARFDTAIAAGFAAAELSPPCSRST